MERIVRFFGWTLFFSAVFYLASVAAQVQVLLARRRMPWMTAVQLLVFHAPRVVEPPALGWVITGFGVATAFGLLLCVFLGGRWLWRRTSFAQLEAAFWRLVDALIEGMVRLLQFFEALPDRLRALGPATVRFFKALPGHTVQGLRWSWRHLIDEIKAIFWSVIENWRDNSQLNVGIYIGLAAGTVLVLMAQYPHVPVKTVVLTVVFRPFELKVLWWWQYLIGAEITALVSLAMHLPRLIRSTRGASRMSAAEIWTWFTSAETRAVMDLFMLRAFQFWMLWAVIFKPKYLIVGAGCYIAGMVNAMVGGGTYFVVTSLLLAGYDKSDAAGISFLVVTVGLIGATLNIAPAVIGQEKRVGVSLLGGGIGGFIGALIAIKIGKKAFENVLHWVVLGIILLYIGEPGVVYFLKLLFGFSQTLGLPALGLVIAILSLYGGFFGAWAGGLMQTGLALSIRNEDPVRIDVIRNVALLAFSLTAGLLYIYYGYTDLFAVAIGAPAGWNGALAGNGINRFLRRITPPWVYRLIISCLGLFSAWTLGLNAEVYRWLGWRK